MNPLSITRCLGPSGVLMASSEFDASRRRCRPATGATLGDDRERALEAVFAGVTAAMLVEMARHARLDRKLHRRLKELFGRFFRDRWVARMRTPA